MAKTNTDRIQDMGREIESLETKLDYFAVELRKLGDAPAELATLKEKVANLEKQFGEQKAEEKQHRERWDSRWWTLGLALLGWIVAVVVAILKR